MHKNHSNLGGSTIAEPTLATVEVEPEFVDAHGLQAIFGIRRTLAYDLLATGHIRSVSLRRPGHRRKAVSPGSKRKAGHLEAGLERRAGDGIVEVPLTQGKVAIVDAQDAERVLCHKWYTQRNYTSSHDLWYAVTSIQKGGGTQILLSLHRFILQLPPRIPQVDHRDCDGLNNRRSNLRLASNSQNAQNSRISSYNTSG